MPERVLYITCIQLLRNRQNNVSWLWISTAKNSVWYTSPSSRSDEATVYYCCAHSYAFESNNNAITCNVVHYRERTHTWCTCAKECASASLLRLAVCDPFNTVRDFGCAQFAVLSTPQTFAAVDWVTCCSLSVATAALADQATVDSYCWFTAKATISLHSEVDDWCYDRLC